ncbi:nascent polypeptide-associated complex subunit alpha, muscle-specific form-like isoform X2 [Sarcophilus harrisii]|uniref:nascent polypeptide-associated complex subunit alpha, muscle-specific form-like isoform X2 n=1 Tax=Sarcophilus harrisii TaxID=9305 RepID=UPI00062B9408|nr:nascent polypeptide-associated complex subunit alpha, muscle-specific form-like isoform X2 [Sarcophilus harrisii]
MMPRGRAWTQQEISCLLTLIQDSGEVTLLMASTSRPNEALWQSISQGLGASGYGRSVAQCRSKWKALKQAFYSEWETSRQAGAPSSQPPPHYRTMKRLWKAAGRPVFGERRLPGSDTNLETAPAPCAKKESAPPEEKQTSPAPSQIPEPPALVPEIPARPDLVPQGAREEPTPVSGLQGPGVVSLLQNMQELLVQILRTSRQQQALLESLAQDTVSHLHLLSDGLGQMGQTLQALLMHSPSWQSPRPLLTPTPAPARPHPPALGLHAPHSPSMPVAPASPCLKEETILPPPRFAPL